MHLRITLPECLKHSFSGCDPISKLKSLIMTARHRYLSISFQLWRCSMFFLCCIWKWSANTLPSLIPDTLPIQPHAKNEKKYTKSNRTAINSRWPLRSKLARVFDSVAQSDPLLQFWVSPPNNLNYLSYVRSLLCFTLFPYFPSEVFKRRRTTHAFF